MVKKKSKSVQGRKGLFYPDSLGPLAFSNNESLSNIAQQQLIQAEHFSLNLGTFPYSSLFGLYGLEGQTQSITQIFNTSWLWNGEKIKGVAAQ